MRSVARIGAESARESEVLLGHLRERARALPADAERAVSGLVDHAAGDREAAYVRVVEVMRSPRYLELVDRLVQGAIAPRVRPEALDAGAHDLARLARGPCKKLKRDHSRLGTNPADETLHALRIRAKRARYAVEAVADFVAGDAPRELAAALANLQDVLGAHQDAVVAQTWFAPSSSVSSARAATATGRVRPRRTPPACSPDSCGPTRSLRSTISPRRGSERITSASRRGCERGDDAIARGRRRELMISAAGGIVTRPAGGGVEVLLVHRPKYDDWTLPKGKVDPGERDEDAAVREVREETGYECTLGNEGPSVHYVDGRGRPKRVRYWLMTVAGGAEAVPNAEVDELRWLSAADAATLLTYPHDQPLVSCLGAAP